MPDFEDERTVPCTLDELEDFVNTVAEHVNNAYFYSPVDDHCRLIATTHQSGGYRPDITHRFKRIIGSPHG